MAGDSPLYVRRVGERHKIVRQTDSGFGIDARAGLGSPSSPEALLNSSLPHDLVMGGISCGGSRQGSSPGEGLGYSLQCSWASLVAQMVKNPPAVWETWV